MKAVLRVLFVCIGAAVLINGIVLSFTSNINLGNVFTILLGALIITVSLFSKQFFRFKLIAIPVSVLLCLYIALSCFLFAFGAADSASFKEDAVIVLGAAVHGETPSLVLQERLDKAVEYHKKNPDALLVVSGGQGPQEDISEAEAMKRYLISKGVSEEKIIKEDLSTSTLENFENSKKILDSLLGEDYTVAYVTNEYHVFRAGQIAKKAGVCDTTHLHSGTRWHSVLPGTLRESAAVLYFFVFGN